MGLPGIEAIGFKIYLPGGAFEQRILHGLQLATQLLHHALLNVCQLLLLLLQRKLQPVLLIGLVTRKIAQLLVE